MQNIFEKIHTYDIVVYLIPGILTIYYICCGIKLMNLLLPNSINNFVTDSIIFFVISYYAGIIIQEIAYKLQNFELHRLWHKPYSKQLLHKCCSILSSEDKQRGWNILKKDFNIQIDLKTKNKKELDKRIDDYSQILYERCRECLKYEYKNYRKLDQAEIFNIHYGLSRNLLATTLISIIYFCIVSIYIHIHKLPFFIISVVIMFLSYIFAKLLYQRTRKYAIYHVRNVIILYLSIFGGSPFPKNQNY